MSAQRNCYFENALSSLSGINFLSCLSFQFSIVFQLGKMGQTKTEESKTIYFRHRKNMNKQKNILFFCFVHAKVAFIGLWTKAWQEAIGKNVD